MPGKGKARAPYEFGCKVLLAGPGTQPKGGQFVPHARALHGNPFDGHTLRAAIADVETISGVEVKRIHVDKGNCQSARKRTPNRHSKGLYSISVQVARELPYLSVEI